MDYFDRAIAVPERRRIPTGYEDPRDGPGVRSRTGRLHSGRQATRSSGGLASIAAACSDRHAPGGSSLAIHRLLARPASSTRTCASRAWPVEDGPGQKGDVAKAIADDNEAAEPGPRDARTYVTVGDDHAESGDLDKAIADYTEAIKLDARYAQAYSRRASAWMKKHQRQNAIADYSAAIALEPMNPFHFLSRGAVWSRQGDHAPAIADFDEAIRLDPNDAGAFVVRAREWELDYQLDKAIFDYQKAIAARSAGATVAYEGRGQDLGEAAGIRQDRRQLRRARPHGARQPNRAPRAGLAPGYLRPGHHPRRPARPGRGDHRVSSDKLGGYAMPRDPGRRLAPTVGDFDAAIEVADARARRSSPPMIAINTTYASRSVKTPT